MFVKEARRKGGGVAPREGVYLQQSLAPGWRLWAALSSKADQVKSLRCAPLTNRER
jgi:hypothetical protein